MIIAMSRTFNSERFLSYPYSFTAQNLTAVSPGFNAFSSAKRTVRSVPARLAFSLIGSGIVESFLSTGFGNCMISISHISRKNSVSLIL